jgi:quinol monooxygenase YgiN
MIAVIATLTARPDTADQVAALLEAAAPHCRSDAEPGCLVYQPARSLEDPNVFKVLEVYRSADAIAAHRESPHFQPLKHAFATMLAAPPQVERLEAFG